VKIEIQLYKFSELSKQAKESAIGWHCANMFTESRNTETYPEEKDVIKSIETNKMLFSKNGKSEERIKRVINEM